MCLYYFNSVKYEDTIFHSKSHLNSRGTDMSSPLTCNGNIKVSTPITINSGKTNGHTATTNGREKNGDASPMDIPSSNSFMDGLVSSSPGSVKIKCRRVEDISPVGNAPLPGSPRKALALNVDASENGVSESPKSSGSFRVSSTTRDHKITSEVYTLVYVS